MCWQKIKSSINGHRYEFLEQIAVLGTWLWDENSGIIDENLFIVSTRADKAYFALLVVGHIWSQRSCWAANLERS